jgi:hypothetical protein
MQVVKNNNQIPQLFSDIVEVGGLKYKLQHPGNRAWIKLKPSLINMTTREFNLEKLMDYAFEHCVFPEGHSFEPTIDNIDLKDSETWEVLLPNFFRGKIDPKFKPKDKGSQGTD